MKTVIQVSEITVTEEDRVDRAPTSVTLNDLERYSSPY